MENRRSRAKLIVSQIFGDISFEDEEENPGLCCPFRLPSVVVTSFSYAVATHRLEIELMQLIQALAL